MLIGFDTGSYYTEHDSDNRYATQSFISTAIAALVNSAPAALDTLKELATALNNDASFSTTITTLIGTKQPLITSTTDLTCRSLTLSADILCNAITTRSIGLNNGGAVASIDSSGVALLYNGVGLRINSNDVSLTGYQKTITCASPLTIANHQVSIDLSAYATTSSLST